MSRFSGRNVLVALHDIGMAALSFCLAVYLRLGAEQMHLAESYLLEGTVLFSVVCGVTFAFMHVYSGLWRYTSMRDLTTIIRAVTVSLLIFFALMFMIDRAEGLPRSVPFINWMVLLLLLAGPRFVWRAIHDQTVLGQDMAQATVKIPVMLLGVNHTAERFIRDMARDPKAPYEVVAVVDEDSKQKRYMLHRVPVYTGSNMIELVIRKLERKQIRPQKIILTAEQSSADYMRSLLDKSDALGIPLARLPKSSEFEADITGRKRVRPVAVEDLLGRSQNVLDRDAMQALVTQKSILVTGAGGTIGGELTRQIATYEPSQIVLVERSEFNLYKIEHELRTRYPEMQLRAVLADVADARHIDDVFTQHKPEIVFHAAAIKHVPLAEENVEEAVFTNVFGTRTIAETCAKHNAEVMVMISTDKAVNPTNVMGASKRLAECFCQALGSSKRSDTRFITVRFGNVLGSTGSVVPLFQEQIAAGGPVTVTHPDMTRYFMTVREAVELVMQAASLGAAMQDRNECVFVLDMGKPMKILDLAHQMIRLAGLRPGEDIAITYTGLRQGEKLYEELFYLSENAAKTAHDSIFLASPSAQDIAVLKDGLTRLRAACEGRGAKEVRELLKQMVPEYKPAIPVKHDYKTRPDLRIVKNKSH